MVIIIIITKDVSKELMKTNILGAMTVTAIFLAGFVSISYIGNVFSQGTSNEKSNIPGSNMTAMSSNASSMEANVTGANANNTNQSAPTAANMTAANASQSNASLSS